eukprot:TRINITY_DN14075_c0_g1_i5.p1 TRINITY_DN14075_c0_g1~~TRINITY_DN14075_c0_g1_i5.p1  ORF type:complete len:1165 (-),score=301.36 TRINITY_DN14075_c0_g1_i5:79-3573(-)
MAPHSGAANTRSSKDDQSDVNFGSPEAFAKWTEELLLLEKSAEEEETSELLQSCTQAELQARGVAVLKLAVAEQTTALYGRTCLTLERSDRAPLPVHRISHGDIVGLFDQHSRPLSKAQPLASAVVQRVRSTCIALAFDGEVPNEVLDGRQLSLASISTDVTLRRYREALELLQSGRIPERCAGVVATCFGDGAAAPRFREVKSEGCMRPDAVDCEFRAEQTRRLNEPQQAAVVQALRAADISVVHGPPGTGKTTTLVAFILEAAYRKQRLLVTAPSNVAVDNLLERVLDCGLKSVVRLGHPARVQNELHAYTLDNVVYSSDQAALCRDIKKEIDDTLKKCVPNRGIGVASRKAAPVGRELSELRKELRQRERRAVAEVLRHTQVVFATCAGAATLHRELRRGGGAGTAGDSASELWFDVVVIDEAAQALEAACWIPMLLGSKTVLAGDHQQLSACVKSTEAQRKGLDRTLFARIIDRYGDDVSALLSIQYRMNSTIMGWSSRSFYASRLEAADSVASRTLELREVPDANLVGETLDAMRAPLLFVDTAGLAQYREDGSDEAVGGAVSSSAGSSAAVHQSRGNPGEALFLVHYAKMLVRCGIQPKDITVITPYNRQVELLVARFAEDPECSKLGLERPRVNTVDSFQGQEADAVLLSLVRSNERGVVGFLADYRRLNVAVTRARKHVMLVGDAGTIATDSMLASLYDYACEHGRVAYVQQLLDEEGNVPPDPAEAAEVAKRGKGASSAAKKLEKGRERRQEQEQDEERLRQRFEAQFRPLLETESEGVLVLPKSLNPYERAIAHEVATGLRLQHESRGEGLQRRLCLSRPGVPLPEPPAPSSEPGAAAGKAKAKAKAKAKGAAAGDGAGDKDAEEEEEPEGETVLEAFERRASATLATLSAEQPAAEWKAPSEAEYEVLQRLAAAKGLQLSTVGSGKKRRCRVEGDWPAPAASAKSTEASSAGGYPPAGADSANGPAGAAGAAANGSNTSLAALHAERQQRQREAAAKQAEAAAERQRQNEAAKTQMKAAKKANKAKQASVPSAADDDDLDALLEEFQTKDGLCAFGTCKEKIHTLMDMISKCKHCQTRYCLKHFQPEAHGCGDAANRSEQQRFRDAASSSLAARGSGLQGKPCGDARGAVAARLQDKLKQSETSRTTKKKDKK